MGTFDYDYIDEGELIELKKQRANENSDIISFNDTSIKSISEKSSQNEKRTKNITLMKKEAYILLYEKIEYYYKKFKATAFELLNDSDTKDYIVETIVEKFENNKEIELYLRQNYFKISKQLYNEYKHHIQPDDFEENEDDECEEESKGINWGYLFITILKILLFPIILTIGFALNYKPGNKKR